MSSRKILEILREATMPIHRKLDNKGIGQKIRNNTFNIEDYKDWLFITEQSNQFLFNEKIKFKNSTLYHYLDFDLGLSAIAQDIAIHCSPSNQAEINSIYKSIADSSYSTDYLIAIIYTFLGSTLGSRMILAYVKQHIPEASTLFLEKMSHFHERWEAFKDEVTCYDLTIPEENLSDYSRSIFEQIHQIQTHITN